jgi:hypothetical protein
MNPAITGDTANGRSINPPVDQPLAAKIVPHQHPRHHRAQHRVHDRHNHADQQGAPEGPQHLGLGQRRKQRPGPFGERAGH